MDDLEQKIGEVLGDPEQMQKIMQMAKSLGLGGLESPEAIRPPAKSGGREAALMEALKPFLSPRHRQKLERAMQISRLSRLAKLAMEQSEEKEQSSEEI